MNAIELSNLTKRFGALTAVDGLDLSIPKGELFGLVGSDGAGKTTTLRMLTGVLDAGSGDATVLGFPCHDLEPVRSRIGYMSQRFGLYPDLTVMENIRFHADIFGVPKAEWTARAERLLAMSGLTPFTKRRAGALSGGMKQKLGLCCALIHTPQVLFLDEPTNGVDPVSRRDFWRILDTLLAEGVTIMVATAYLDEAERCHRVGLLHHGRLLACDRPQNLKALADPAIQNPTLEDVFITVLGKGADTAVRRRPAPELHAAAPAVTLAGLTRCFGDFVAVNSISLTVPKGEIFGFLGPNGAGKSTTIRMLCGILEPSSGNGMVAGFDVAGQAELIKENIGYMSQKFSLYEDLTVAENIAFYGGIYRLPAKELAERADWVIEMAGLTERRNSKAGELSAGWRQRLALGCALLHRPPIIFLDEPTAGVDPLNRRRFWQLIHNLASEGVTIFVTTHYMDEAEYCDRLALIYRGELVAVGTPLELKRQQAVDGLLPSLEQVFIDLIEQRDAQEGGT
ncbi:ABC transporter related [Trichlorobacter lovleyi SZ]|uniref:ABC transporter related n=1 Tax=Trichlorobacter lovleyi (strain ATCC BAA-1151 / DSM 17278 / SZ) TaxID=398767 RepID=B3E9T7_TRIL1|nr:ATP-binding cassette domain-containing protein [Trichlorobacter lovleyi]ACD96812.1 ABC transporter related [Trichlorobacter lovleyi SZ]